MNPLKIIGPFSQIVSLQNLSDKGPIQDESLEILENGGIVIDEVSGTIVAVSDFKNLKDTYKDASIELITHEAVLLPGFIDCHTHICWGGSRARDYAMRVAGKPYLEIARAGGGIWDSVQKTRAASLEELTSNTIQRANRHLKDGITTIEVKSGYALNVEDELKMLHAIKLANDEVDADLVPTCLAAHIKPKDFEGDAESYLNHILEHLLPIVKKENLANRVDIFIEDTAFDVDVSEKYLLKAKEMGFDITIHADQFYTGGSLVGRKVGARSVEHLENSSEEEIEIIASSEMIAVALPGASLGLGMKFTPARKLLDAGACLAISTDWNPGSAPMGDLLTQAAILGAAEKLSTAETLAGLTFRAAKALNLHDRGKIENGKLADLQAYPTHNFQEILYQQGRLKPFAVWKKGIRN